MLISMMEFSRKQVASLSLVCLISLPLQAQVIPGRWEKVSALQVASPITVELKDGDRIKGHYEDLSDTDVMLVTHFSRAVIPKEDIETITTQPVDDLSNGTLIGGGIGAGIMSVWTAAWYAKSYERANALGILMMAGIGFGIGAGLGAAGDALEKPVPIVLYEAP